MSDIDRCRAGGAGYGPAWPA